MTDSGSRDPILDEGSDTRTCKEIFFDGIKEGSIYISFTVIALAIVFSMMTVNWTKMIYNEEESKSMVFGVLLFSIIIGNICIFLLLFFVVFDTEGERDSLKPRSFYEGSKLFIAIVFAFCNLGHCALYINKHVSGTEGCTDKGEGIAYNVFSVVYTFMLMCGIFAFKVRKTTVFNKFLSVGILFANFSFWLDTIFSESGELFEYYSDQTNAPNAVKNETKQIISCNYTEDAIGHIEKFDPLLSPGTVEFAIITVDLLFSYAYQKHHNRHGNQSNVINNQQDSNGSERKRDFGKICLIVLFGIFSFALFVTSVVGYTKRSDEENTVNDKTDTVSTIFKAYISASLIVKLTMFVCVNLCTFLAWGSFKYEFGMEGLILIVSCFLNVVYHMFYLFAVWKSYKDAEKGTGRSYLAVSYFENILSIIIAGEQTMFILATETGEKLRKNKNKTKIYFICLLMTITNFGLWISDSFGESKVAALSIVIKNNYSETFWVIFTKLVLPFTIFFRLHSGLILLKMFGDRNAEEDNEVVPPERNRYGSSA